MKFCPKCGNELPDEANFCPKCGAKQPDAQVVEQEIEENVSQINPTIEKSPQNQEESPRQRYNNLVKNDEVFKEIVTVRRKKYLFELIFLVFIISWIVAMFTPVAKLTGEEMSSNGASILGGLGIAVPYEFSPFDLIELDTLSGKSALTPGGLSSAYAVMGMIIGIVLMILSAGLPVLKAFTGRSYVLKQYEAGKAKELIKETSNPYFAGAFFNIVVLIGSINLFASTSDIKYEYKDSSRYIFGEMASLPGNFVVVIATSVILAVLTLVASIVVSKIMTRKLRKFALDL